jgi:hypothetical protein
MDCTHGAPFQLHCRELVTAFRSARNAVSASGRALSSGFLEIQKGETGRPLHCPLLRRKKAPSSQPTPLKQHRPALPVRHQPVGCPAGCPSAARSSPPPLMTRVRFGSVRVGSRRLLAPSGSSRRSTTRSCSARIAWWRRWLHTKNTRPPRSVQSSPPRTPPCGPPTQPAGGLGAIKGQLRHRTPAIDRTPSMNNDGIPHPHPHQGPRRVRTF